MMLDYVDLAIPLLGILCGLLALGVGRNMERIKKLEHQTSDVTQEVEQ